MKKTVMMVVLFYKLGIYIIITILKYQVASLNFSIKTLWCIIYNHFSLFFGLYKLIMAKKVSQYSDTQNKLHRYYSVIKICVVPMDVPELRFV